MSLCQHDDCDREGIAAWNGCVFCDEHVRERLRTTEDGKLLARVAELETALREIGDEIAAHGCDGPFEEVCINAERSPEDWCRYCRMGTTITSILPYTGITFTPENLSTGSALSDATQNREGEHG